MMKNTKIYGADDQFRIVLTRQAVGVNPKPPKNPKRSPKKGKVTPTNNVKAEVKEITFFKVP